MKLISIAAAVIVSASVLAESESGGKSIHPKGDTFPFLGYSGKAEEQARDGFTIFGPVYGGQDSQRRSLEEARSAGLPFVYAVGAPVNFHSNPQKLLEPERVAEIVAEQVSALADDDSICWWYVHPEELRHWRAKEMEYLQTVVETIRANDPRGRPIWMYEPNHRKADSLVKTGLWQDIIGKGSYVNLSGHKDSRIWVRYSIEQQLEAARLLEAKDGRPRTVLLMPELCADPQDEAEDVLIERWVRHDVYLGLMTGAEGVAIWSMWPRAGVRRTYSVWREAYNAVAREITGELGLGQVFLNGVACSEISFELLSGPSELELFTGSMNDLEAGNLTEAEKAGQTKVYPAVMIKALRHRGRIYVFACNSSPAEATEIEISGWEHGARLQALFPHGETSAGNDAISTNLGPQQVKAWIVHPPILE
jgi:hypothetical protein